MWKFKESNHQGHDFYLLALKFKLRCVSRCCNVTMVTYYIPKAAICNECTCLSCLIIAFSVKDIIDPSK